MWHTLRNVCCACKISSPNHIGGGCGQKKQNQSSKMRLKVTFLEYRFCFFYHAFHPCHFMTNFCMHNKHFLKYATKKFQNFLKCFSILFILLFIAGAYELRCRNSTSLTALYISHLTTAYQQKGSNYI